MAWSTARKEFERDMCERVNPFGLWIDRTVARNAHGLAWFAVTIFSAVCLIVGAGIESIG